MQRLNPKLLKNTVKDLALSANFDLDKRVEKLIRKAEKQEISPNGKIALKIILENIKLARKKKMPICQDTGLAVFFLELGRNLKIDFDLTKVLNQGLREASREGFLRNSVADPISRKNTKDNTPAIIHLNLTDGNRLKIKLLIKGAGSENQSLARMLKPGEGIEGIKKAVVEWVQSAGGKACPPIFIGLGIGGDLELSALLAKKALLRPAGSKNQDPVLAHLEKEILEAVNQSGIGPGGLGGRFTALAVQAEKAPGHIASLALAINLQCWAHRSAEAVL